VDIEDYNPDILNIFSREVLQMISDGNDGWEVMLPPGVSKIIKEKNLFGHQAIRQEATKQ
ncbi:MAG: nicotinate-nucleotide adenylyltransferase, partial [Flavobacteriaceae bacterium CG_4_8_14_3_um_filter_34_10]